MDLNNPKKLCRAAEIGFAKMEHYRRSRFKFLAQYIGRFYSKSKGIDAEDKKASPINLLFQAVSTLVPNLVYRDPKFRARTNVMAFRDYADTLELGLNHLAGEIKLRRSLRKAVTAAIFGAGFLKTGIAASGQTLEVHGESPLDIGQPYGDNVDLDDMLIDPLARDWEEQEFVGNRFRLPKDVAQESGLYDPDTIAKFSSRYDDSKYKAEASSLGDAGNAADQYREVQEYIDLVELYLPREQLIVTIPYSRFGSTDKFLRVVEYEGPESGPYHLLGFNFVPDNILPVAPVSIWYDLHILANRIARKIARQAERNKRVLAVEKTSFEDGQTIAEADDGETVTVDSVNGIKEVNYGGTSDEAYEFMEWVKRNFSEQAGNIDLLSGQDTNSPTATQAEMLQSNSSVRLADAQGIVYQFTAEVGRDLAFFLHTDPLISLPLVRRVGGIDQQVFYTPEMRRGDWLDYMISVQPFSMARQDPNVKVRRILEFASTVIPACAQAFQLLGPAFKIDSVLALIAKEVGIEEADEIINSAALQAQVMQMMMTVPPDGKAAGMGGLPPPPLAGPGGPPVPGMNIGQPNPAQMGPTGGLTPDTEQAAAQQETAGELQGAYPSARALAMVK